MKYLVTGATGFIGRELCRQLAAAGLSALALSRGGGPLVDGSPALAMDLAAQLPPANMLSGVEVVFHLAGIAHQQAEPAAYERVNYQATLGLARAAAAAGVRCFVFVSSVKAMGPATGSVARAEADCTSPQGDYARSKWRAECALREEFAGSDMAVVILRPALVYGDGVKGNLQRLASAVRRGLPRPPPLGGRSMIALADLVALLCELGERPPEGIHTWIVCDGQVYSTRRVCDAMRAGLGLGPGTSWCPQWLWQLATMAMDRGRPVGDESTFQRLFGYEVYSNSALLAASPWRAGLQLEDVVTAMLAPPVVSAGERSC